MRNLARSAAMAALGTALGLGCQGRTGATPRAAQPQASAPVAARASAVALLDRDWGRTSLRRAALQLSLPELSAWRRTKPSAWEHLEHRASRSRIDLRITRAERLVRPRDCEARARLERPDLPALAPEDEALDRRSLRAPPGFLTEVTVSVFEAPAELEGHVTAFGAAVGRCLAFHFVTRASGSGASEEIARRLGLVVAKLLPSLSLFSVDDRVAPEPLER